MTVTLPKLPPIVAGYVALAAIGGLAVVWLLNGGAKTVARAAAAVPGNVAGGVVEGIGDSIGVPRTSESECEAALREGRIWDASFACPAGKFIGGLFGGGEAAAPINRNADTSGVPFY